MRRRVHLALLGLAAVTAATVPATALAQTPFPEKPVRIVVPYPPGGATDVSARLLAGEMTKQIGQTVIVENKPGVAGVIGTDMVAKSAADGYTLVFGGPGNLTLRPIMDPNLSYKVDKDLAPISHVVTYDHVFVVRNGLPARNIQEFIKVAKERKLTYGSSGSGGPQHLAMELFKHMTQTDLTHVPYKGEAPAMLDLVGERVDAAIISTAVAGQLIKGGKVRAIAATNPYRSKTFPELPTVSEAGVTGYEMESYGGLLAPAGTPAPVIEKLQRVAMAAMKVPSVQQQFHEAGLFPIGGSATDLTKLLRKEREKWAPIIKSSGVKLE
ncbi:Bug family tripartite tricarboxylate transporter substrate binding protein [Ramlibacter sp.]|uniref:Bug family tripartite tricarboxylate transporter substrate binding protein n=1 Tax=Ramlibacter sp. TaxID=1917967 RepID=UPI003D0B48DF